MFGRSLRTLRPRSGAPIRSLKRRLKALRASNEAAQNQLLERRRLAALSMRVGHGSGARGGDEAGADRLHTAGAYEALRQSSLQLLPRNPSLEASIAFVLHENRDARAELEFTRQLLSSTLLSLAAPVSPVWDPYDVKPQVFALDTYMALPVFTSIEYVAHFCRRFGFTVRDPSGTLWTDGAAAAQSSDETPSPLLLPNLSALEQSEWWHAATANTHNAEPSSRTGATTTSTPENTSEGTKPGGTPGASPPPPPPSAASDVDYLSADALFDDIMNDIVIPQETARAAASHNRKQKRRKRRSGQSARRRLKKRAKAARGGGTRSERTGAAAGTDAAAAEADAQAQARREAFMAQVAAVTPFGIRQATPLPAFGPPVRPFFVGYFADINTLLHNAAIVPDAVDLVVNPGSPIEFVLAREATNRILHKDQLLLHAYQRVERELQHEFSLFFARYCPAVRAARSACVPRPIDYEVAVEAVRQARRYHGGRDDDEDKGNPLTSQREHTRVLRESEYSNGVAYELVILLDCEDAEGLAETYHRLQEGKRRCLIMGHAELDVLPEAGAAPAVREAAKVFYERRAHADDANAHAHIDEDVFQIDAGQPTTTPSGMGVFRVAGAEQTVSATQSADSYFHDPTNAYTEPHAVFTEELKLTRSH